MTTSCTRAISWGVVWPVIVLPESMCRRGNETQLRAILLHELAHVARRDAWGNALLSLALPVLYWQPLFWWLRSQVRLAAELVADDWAAREAGAGKDEYARELVALARSPGGLSLPLVGAIGVFSSTSQFYRRMQMLLTRETPLAISPSPRWKISALLSICVIVVLGAAIAGVQPAAGEPAKPELPADTQVNAGEAALAEQTAVEEKPASAEAPATTTREETKPTGSLPGLSELPVVGKLFEKPAAESTAEANPADTTPEGKPAETVVPQDPGSKARASTLSKRILREGELNLLRDELEKVIKQLRTIVMMMNSVPSESNHHKRLQSQIDSLEKRKTELSTRIDALDDEREAANDGIDITRANETGESRPRGKPGRLSDRVIRDKEIKTVQAELERVVEDLYRFPRSIKPETIGTDKFNSMISELEKRKTELAARLDELDAQSAKRVDREVPVPPEYKKLVESYSRGLSKQAGKSAAETQGAPSPAVDRVANGISQAKSDSDSPVASARQMDLVALATAYVDALADADAAKVRLDAAKVTLEGLEAANNKNSVAVSQHEIRELEVPLKNAKRKATLLNRIARSALVTAEADVKRVQELRQAGRADVTELAEPASRVEILREILRTEE
jgi:hypothetical protein